jgi:subtilisin family serine protease
MRLFATLLAAVLTLALASSASAAGTAQIAPDRYTVLLAGTQTGDGFEASAAPAAVRSAVAAAGGAVVRDLSRQVGVLVVTSPNTAFADVLRGTGLVEDVGRDFRWRGQPSDPGGGPLAHDDALESLQWDMRQIRTREAHAVQGGARSVDVGILDSGIDGRHPEFMVGPGGPNVDCARGRNSITFVPTGPGVGTPDPCTDNQFHGTHVAGTVGMQANGLGMVGVAPNVTLVPVKVCDATGFCYASPVVDGITYAGDQQFDVINMSFFVDDDEFQESTEFKCSSDPVQRTFRHAVERAIQYARGQGVTPVAALGNSDNDLAHPPEPYTNECEVVPAETQGVVGVTALGRNSEKSGYSNYGAGPADVAAPGGNGTTGDCNTTVPSAFPGGGYVCIQGTSMASPHAAGVAALIVSQFGRLGDDGDVKLSPQKVESLLQSSAIDIGETGYDECFGHGRIDALRAVTGETGSVRDETAPDCPEYQE